MASFLFVEFICPGVCDLVRGLSGSSAGSRLSCILWRIGLRLPTRSLLLYRLEGGSGAGASSSNSIENLQQ